MAGRGPIIPVCDLHNPALQKLGAEGYGCLTLTRLVLWEAPQNKLEYKIELLSFLTRQEAKLVQKTVDIALNTGLLATDKQAETTYIYSPSIAADAGRLQSKLNNLRQFAPTRKPESDAPNACNVMLCNDLDLKKSKKKPKKNILADLVFPQELSSPQCRAAWDRWIEHRKAIRKPYRTLHAAQSTLNEWSAKADKFIAAVEWSRTKEYQGLFEKPENQTPSRAVQTGFDAMAWAAKKQAEGTV